MNLKMIGVFACLRLQKWNCHLRRNQFATALIAFMISLAWLTAEGLEAQAILTRADARDAFLPESHVSGARLVDARSSGVDLTGARMSGIGMQGLTGLARDYAGQAFWDAKYPAGKPPDWIESASDSFVLQYLAVTKLRES